MIYGYARVSTADQNLDRQLVQLKEVGIEERNILCDKASGKSFDRRSWNLLVGSNANASLLRDGDLLVITSLDRLGRNYQEIREQWQHVTRDLQVDIRVLDMPLLDTSAADGTLDRQFIADLVLQILSYTAEKERLNTRARQAQGIAVAKAQGKHLGRPVVEFPDNWGAVYDAWKSGQITATAAMQQLHLKKTTFYNLARKYAESAI